MGIFSIKKPKWFNTDYILTIITNSTGAFIVAHPNPNELRMKDNVNKFSEFILNPVGSGVFAAQLSELKKLENVYSGSGTENMSKSISDSINGIMEVLKFDSERSVYHIKKINELDNLLVIIGFNRSLFEITNVTNADFENLSKIEVKTKLKSIAVDLASVIFSKKLDNLKKISESYEIPENLLEEIRGILESHL
ncbi:MAG: hypothetical protein GON13_03435 [Nanoarchaeota archaeon]|nr:hypothetical protein [Nanoarchaeota archaeon]